jgi:hypothetical protein
MNLDLHKEEILTPLRSKALKLRNEDAAWTAVKDLAARQLAEPMELQALTYALALVYARHTGAIPGYTNADTETVFEKFAGAFLRPVMPRATQNQVRAAKKKIDPKRNAQFQADLNGVAPPSV